MTRYQLSPFDSSLIDDASREVAGPVAFGDVGPAFGGVDVGNSRHFQLQPLVAPQPSQT
jgi:hypothetical protein